jgi:hypothetical protein
MTGIDAKHALELAPAEDEQPIETLAPHAADPALGACVRVLHGCADHRDPFALEDMVEAAAELESRSWISKRSGLCRSSIVISRLRACWAVQAPVGFEVQATNSIRRRSSERKKSTIRFSQAVSTVK